MPINYSSHGGLHRVAVVHCPKICHDRLVHLSQDGEDSWVIRDYIVGLQLRRSPSPNPSFSDHTLAQIEAEIKDSEFPPFHAWEHITDWEPYLRLRSILFFERRPSLAQPNREFGNWQPLQ